MGQLTSVATDKAPTRKDDVVVLVVPADGSYLAVLRTATAGLAARLQFTLDEIEDLRIAVDEASAMLLALLPARVAGRNNSRGGSDGSPGVDLTCQFDVTDEALSIEVAVPVSAPAGLPGGQSFSWQVLTALAGEVSADTGGDRVAIRLMKRRSPTG